MSYSASDVTLHETIQRPRASGWIVYAREPVRQPQYQEVGVRVPEIDRDDVREVLLRGYRIVYRVLEHEIHVLTVFEGHRLFPASSILDED